MKTRYARSRANARKRKKAWEITIEEYEKLIDLCFYCQKDVKLEIGTGLDRIDNAKGYLIDNVLSCCGDCNKMRGNYLTVEEMTFVMSELVKYRKNKLTE